LEDVIVGEEDAALLVVEGDQPLGMAGALDDAQATATGDNDVALHDQAIAGHRLRHHDDALGPHLVDLEEVVGDAKGAARAPEEVAAANRHALPVGHERPVDAGADHLAADPVLDHGAEPEMVDVAMAEDQLLDRVGFGARAADELKEVVNGEVQAGAGVEQRHRVAEEEVDVDAADVERNRAAQAPEVVGDEADLLRRLDQMAGFGCWLGHGQWMILRGKGPAITPR
jgi:hypothetical protein